MLTPCPRCRRHVRSETSCPFCAVPARLGLGVPLAVGLALSGCGGVQSLPPTTPIVRDDGNTNAPPDESPPDEIRTAPAYGAAPLPPEPVPAPPPDEDPRPVAAYGGPSMP